MRERKQTGFTIVELLIVIVVIAILAAITIVAFNGIQDRARNTKIMTDIRGVHRMIEAYNAEKGAYPSTGGTHVVFVDESCSITTANRSASWVPQLTQRVPQSDGNAGGGIGGSSGCYMYASDGASYILSAWNMLRTPQTGDLYRRIGFREASLTSQYFICNHFSIGGNHPTPYDINRDYYKRSYTITNMTGCSETPPAGA